jgi:hypothetical protein
MLLCNLFSSVRNEGSRWIGASSAVPRSPPASRSLFPFSRPASDRGVPAPASRRRIDKPADDGIKVKNYMDM